VSVAAVKAWAGTALEPNANETLWVACTLGLQLSVTKLPEEFVVATGAGVVRMAGAMPIGRLLLVCSAPLVSVKVTATL
jgi:hypothetical protein